MMQQSLRLSLCGAPTLTLPEQLPESRLTGKALALFIYLVVNRHPHSRDQLAQLLWSELPAQQARNNLRYLLPELRRAVGDYLTITPEQISFNPSRPHWVDVEVLQHTLLQNVSTVSTAALQSAVDLYQGEFLAGFNVRNAPTFETWVVSQREHLHTLALCGLLTLAKHYYQQGDYSAGLATTQRLLQWEPWHEPAHRLRMQLLAASGQRAAALAQYSLCCEILATELDGQPEVATTALYEQIRNSQVAASSNQATPHNIDCNHPSRSSVPHNLPGQLTAFIGRKAEVETLCAVLRDAAPRLLTLTGLGGSGKTRLALAIAAHEVRNGVSEVTQNAQVTLQQPPRKAHFPDGIWFVPLYGIAPHEDLPNTLAIAIADALGLPCVGPLTPAEQLFDALQARRLLLLLDNFEHLLAGVDFLRDLLQRAPGVKLLVTSRQPLNLPAEFIWQVVGLVAPATDEQLAGMPAVAALYDAVALFVERARRVNPSFQVDVDNLPSIRQICHFVEGLPIALELAAALTRYFSCQALWENLARDYRVLAVAQRDLPPRHRTISAVFEYSWRLLTPTQAQVLAACSLFPQAFTLEAAAAVAGATPAILSELVAQALLKKRADGRFELHALVRQYAADQLHNAPQQEVEYRQRHTDYYCTLLAADALELLRTPAKLQQIQQELPNLRLLLEWGIEQQQFQPLLRVGDGLFLHFLTQGPLQEGWRWCKTISEVWQTQPESADEMCFLALVLVCQAFFTMYLGRPDEVVRLAEQSIALAQQRPDTRALSMAHGIKGFAAFVQGEFTEQERLCRIALSHARVGQIPYMVAVNLAYLGLGLAMQERIPEALAALDEALQIVEQEQLVVLEGYILSDLSFIYALTGDWALADGTTQQALHVSQRVGNTFNRGSQYGRLALTAAAIGDYRRALAWTDRALEFSIFTPDPYTQLSILTVRAHALRHLGDMHATEEVWLEVLKLAQLSKRAVEVAQAHVELGHLLARRQAWSLALAHYQAALSPERPSARPVLAAQAGLAGLYFQQNQISEALACLENIVPRLLTHSLAGEYDVVNATLTVYQVLSHQRDPRRDAIVQRVQAWVEAQARKISDETLRRSFLENVPVHRQLLALRG